MPVSWPLTWRTSAPVNCPNAWARAAGAKAGSAAALIAAATRMHFTTYLRVRGPWRGSVPDLPATKPDSQGRRNRKPARSGGDAAGSPRLDRGTVERRSPFGDRREAAPAVYRERRRREGLHEH